jgi:hypothetical protein
MGTQRAIERRRVAVLFMELPPGDEYLSILEESLTTGHQPSHFNVTRYDVRL